MVVFSVSILKETTAYAVPFLIVSVVFALNAAWRIWVDVERWKEDGELVQSKKNMKKLLFILTFDSVCLDTMCYTTCIIYLGH